jgi:hypothetical protein
MTERQSWDEMQGPEIRYPLSVESAVDDRGTGRSGVIVSMVCLGCATTPRLSGLVSEP